LSEEEFRSARTETGRTGPRISWAGSWHEHLINNIGAPSFSDGQAGRQEALESLTLDETNQAAGRYLTMDHGLEIVRLPAERHQDTGGEPAVAPKQ
jgi:hypothetical protein